MSNPTCLVGLRNSSRKHWRLNSRSLFGLESLPDSKWRYGYIFDRLTYVNYLISHTAIS